MKGYPGFGATRGFRDDLEEDINCLANKSKRMFGREKRRAQSMSFAENDQAHKGF